jgi:CFEM domain
MLAKSLDGCTAGDLACLCTKPDFEYGIRDCANEACLNATAAGIVIAWGQQLCPGAGSSVSTNGPWVVKKSID